MLPLLLPLALSGASFLGGMFGGGKRKSTQTTTPTLDPAYKGLQDIILPSIMNRLQNVPNFTKGLAAQNTADINRTYRLAGTGLANSLTARGLGSSPIAGAGEAQLAGNRASEIVRMKQTLPLLQREAENQDLASALQALSFGRGTSSELIEGGGGGGRLAGGLSSLASMLGFLYGRGMFSRSPTSQALGTNMYLGF